MFKILTRLTSFVAGKGKAMFGALGKYMSQPGFKGTAKWFWRAIDLLGLGSLIYSSLPSDDENTAAAVNDNIMDTILSKTIQSALHCEIDDTRGVGRAMTAAAIKIMSQGVREHNFLGACSLILTGQYIDVCASGQRLYNFEQSKEVLSRVEAELKEKENKVMLAGVGVSLTEEEVASSYLSQMLDDLNEDETPPLILRNIDYLTYFFDNVLQLNPPLPQ